MKLLQAEGGGGGGSLLHPELSQPQLSDSQTNEDIVDLKALLSRVHYVDRIVSDR